MFKEKQHFSSLIFSHPSVEKPIGLIGTILTGSFEATEDAERSKSSFTHLEHYSQKPYKMTAEEAKAIDLFKKKKRPHVITKAGHEQFVYDCYLKSITYHTNDQPKFIFCTPIYQILKVVDSKADKLKSEKVTFYRLRLPDFCKYLRENNELGMRVKRMNMQVHEGIEEAHGVALYGKDVLKSTLYEILMDYTEPTSLQIVYKNEQDREIVFNVDRSGNWSFYLRVQKDIHVFAEAFRALGNAGLLKKTHNDPRRRESKENINGMADI